MKVLVTPRSVLWVACYTLTFTTYSQQGSNAYCPADEVMISKYSTTNSRAKVLEGYRVYLGTKTEAGLSTILSQGPAAVLRFRGYPTNQLTGTASERLRNVEGLEMIELDCFMPLRLEVVTPLSHLPQLREIYCRNSDLLGTNWSCLTCITNLDSLSLRNCKGFGDDQLRALASLPNLRRLVLWDVEPSPTSFGVLNSFPQLREAIVIQGHTVVTNWPDGRGIVPW